MYKGHKFFLKVLFAFSAVAAYLLNFRYAVIASDVIGVVSIASAVYLAVYTGIQSSSKLREALTVRDKEIACKTELGVINTYIKCALVVSTISIIVSLLVLLLDDRFFSGAGERDLCEVISKLFKQMNELAEPSSIMEILERIISALGIGMLSVSFATMWMVGRFMVNRIPYDS